MDDSISSNTDNDIISRIRNSAREGSCVALVLSCNDEARILIFLGRIRPVMDVCINCREERADMVEIDV